MANFNFGHSFPRVFIGTGAFATSGNTADLNPGEIGIFDKTTFDALNMGAAIPAAYHKRQIMFAQGAYHTKDSLTSGNFTDNFQGLQKSVKSLGVLTKYVNSVTKTTPKSGAAESWVIGWDGFSDCCATPKCDSVYTVRLDAKGEVIRRLLNRDWYKELSYQTEVCEGCSSCGAEGGTSKFAMFTAFAKQVNEDPIASKFLKASLMYDKATCPLTTVDFTEYSVDICDAGDILSLAKLQVEYPALAITRTQRDGVDVTNLGDQTKGSTSTYKVVTIDTAVTGDNAPADTAFGTDWVTGAAVFKVERTLFITIPKTEGDAIGRVAAVNTFYIGRADVTAVVDSSTYAVVAADCSQVIELTQLSSNYMEEGCKASDVATYLEVTSFEGTSWDESLPCNTNADCNTCIGLKIETAFVEKKFGNCSFNINDYYNVDGIRLEVSLKDDAALDSHTTWPVKKLSSFVQASGLGETVLRKYITASGYDLPEEQFEMDLRMREVADQQHLNIIDRSASYVKYTLNHSIPHSMNAMGMTGLNNDQTYNLDFYFKDGVDASDFEARLLEIAVEAGLDNAGALFTY